MKIKENYLHEALKTDKNDKPDWKENVRRPSPSEHSETAGKFRPTNSPLKDDLKFASLLESTAKAEKPGQHDESSSDEQREERKNESKREAREKDRAENRSSDARPENYESAGGQTSGQQQSGFGMNGQVGGLNLNENFAARSILHIADLERLVSTVRTQATLGGRREITLQLKRSVLEGLQIKITTGANAKVQLEFLAASENVRAQVEKHSEELASILRGRGIDLETLKTSLASDSSQEESSGERKSEAAAQTQTDAPANGQFSENTFAPEASGDDKIYSA